MFRKRIKKEYPPGTFIPMPARVCAIIQLSLCFMIVLWNGFQPFMGELFAYKSQILLYQDVMGVAKAADEEASQRLQNNRKRFEALSIQEKKALYDGYEQLEQLSQRTFFAKLKKSLSILTLYLPFYERIWLVFSLIIPVLLLKRVEGADKIIWLLPLLTCLYAYDNQRYAKSKTITSDASLFPSEELLITNYLQDPFSDNISKQHEQLLEAWQNYLIQEWTPATRDLSKDKKSLVEDGEFAFNKARIDKLPSPASLLDNSKYLAKESLFTITLYVFWNFFFAFTAFKASRQRKDGVERASSNSLKAVKQ